MNEAMQMQRAQQMQEIQRAQMVEIGGRRCFVRPQKKGLKPKAVLYWGIMAGEGEQVEELCRLLDERDAAASADSALPAAAASDAAQSDTALPAASADSASYLLIAFEAADWNRDFSPWPAPAVFGKENFGGGGAETLDWLIRSAMPEVKAMYGITCGPTCDTTCGPLCGDDGVRQFLGGYSLAGLFSLWAFYESGCFDGVASCSGSLWYPGWQAYVADKAAPAGSLVYLSLGDKEEKTRNQVMAKVGDMTRWQYGQVSRDPNVARSVLEWNAGGHFKEPTARMAKGFAWLLFCSAGG